MKNEDIERARGVIDSTLQPSQWHHIEAINSLLDELTTLRGEDPKPEPQGSWCVYDGIQPPVLMYSGGAPQREKFYDRAVENLNLLNSETPHAIISCEKLNGLLACTAGRRLPAKIAWIAEGITVDPSHEVGLHIGFTNELLEEIQDLRAFKERVLEVVK